MILQRRSFQNLSCLIFVLLLFFTNTEQSRGDFVFQVSANTTAIDGITGSFDLEFNPGGVGTLAATATITNFFTDGSGLSLNTTDGDVLGTLLPGPLTINNTQALNDWLENITFGNNISFVLTLSGPGITSPDASLPGSNFALTLYDVNFNPLLTTDPAGTVVTVNLNPDGSTSAFTFSSDTSGGAPVGTVTPQVTSTPEPASIILFATGFIGIGASRLASRKRHQPSAIITATGQPPAP